MKEKRVHELLDELVKTQLEARGITNKKTLDVFKKVYRHKFVSKKLANVAYADHPLDIGYNQTISQPYIVALMIDSANIQPSDRILEIGTGSGYQTALIAEMAKEVFTLEIKAPLQENAKKVLDKLGYKNIKYKIGNGYFGWSEYAPYDKIIVSAAAYYLPNYLVDQLKDDGKLIIPLDTKSWQELFVITKERFGLKREKLCSCRFVPLVEK